MDASTLRSVPSLGEVMDMDESIRVRVGGRG